MWNNPAVCDEEILVDHVAYFGREGDEVGFGRSRCWRLDKSECLNNRGTTHWRLD
jgi:hypothetical protein